jgi:membrane peptidoglycan carboxypeptidase
MLQGVVARGTARAISALSPYVAGKTGTVRRSRPCCAPTGCIVVRTGMDAGNKKQI